MIMLCAVLFCSKKGRDDLLKACGKCGKIHARDYVCTPAVKYRGNEAIDKFRNSARWRKKAAEIKERDGYMCLVCKAGLYNTLVKYNGVHLSVHHITALAADFSARLDDSNLITLCRYHHEQAEQGVIPAPLLAELVPPCP